MESPALGLSLVGLLVVAALILANAFFVATEEDEHDVPTPAAAD